MSDNTAIVNVTGLALHIDQLTFSEVEQQYKYRKRKNWREIFLERMNKLIPWLQI